MKLSEYFPFLLYCSIVAADWLVADTYSSLQCASDELQLSLMKQAIREVDGLLYF